MQIGATDSGARWVRPARDEDCQEAPDCGITNLWFDYGRLISAYKECGDRRPHRKDQAVAFKHVPHRCRSRTRGARLGSALPTRQLCPMVGRSDACHYACGFRAAGTAY